MFRITDEAGERLTEILDQQDCPEETAVRFVRDGGEIALALDSERPGDQVFRHQGRCVLVVDQELATLLADEVLGVDEGGEGSRLTLSSDEQDDQNMA